MSYFIHPAKQKKGELELKESMTQKADRLGCIVFQVRDVLLPESEFMAMSKERIHIQAVGYPTNWQYKPNYERLAWLLE